jgi:hypothetical protein
MDNGEAGGNAGLNMEQVLEGGWLQRGSNCSRDGLAYASLPNSVEYAPSLSQT